MKQQNLTVTVDINKLSVDELNQLQAILYYSSPTDMNAITKIMQHIAFVNGWMSEKQDREYYETYCE